MFKTTVTQGQYKVLQKGIATYPPVYISALTGAERAKLFRSLNQYAARE